MGGEGIGGDWGARLLVTGFDGMEKGGRSITDSGSLTSHEPHLTAGIITFSTMNQAYMVVCLDMSVDQDVDIVFSEYILWV